MLGASPYDSQLAVFTLKALVAHISYMPNTQFLYELNH